PTSSPRTTRSPTNQRRTKLRAAAATARRRRTGKATNDEPRGSPRSLERERLAVDRDPPVLERQGRSVQTPGVLDHALSAQHAEHEADLGLGERVERVRRHRRAVFLGSEKLHLDPRGGELLDERFRRAQPGSALEDRAPVLRV